MAGRWGAVAGVRPWPWALASSRVLTLGAAVLVACSLIAVFGFGPLRGNEYDVLPVAKQFADAAWLPRDWYLNLPIRYRYAFNLPIGMALRVLPLPTVVLLGRMLVFLGFAGALIALFRALRISLWWCVPCIFLFIARQELGAGEWMVKSLETKTIAYAAALLGLARMAQKRYAATAAWLSVAVLFHVLVGGYAVLCTLSCFALAEHRPFWRSLFCPRWTWTLVILVAVAALGASSALLHQSPAASQGAELYVTLRVPHHTLPSAWRSPFWPFLLSGYLMVFANMRRSQSSARRLLAQYALTALGLFVLGLLVFALGPVSWLRFYWFRFGDTVPLLFGWLALAHWATELDERGGQGRALSQIVRMVPRVTTPVLPVLALGPYVLAQPLSWRDYEIPARRLELPEAVATDMGAWIQRNTARDALFVVDPSVESFYVDAQRAMLVSFKHSPQSELDVLEWYRRLVRLNGGHAPRHAGFEAMRELSRGFEQLSAAQLKALVHDYRVDYVLTKTGSYPFEVAHRDAVWTLYDLRHESRDSAPLTRSAHPPRPL